MTTEHGECEACGRVGWVSVIPKGSGEVCVCALCQVQDPDLGWSTDWERVASMVVWVLLVVILGALVVWWALL